MTPIKHRNKLLAAALAVAMVAAAASALLGSATAASWHTYEGDVYAGHAYGLQVPAGAESFEILFEGESGAARVAVFDPAGEKLGLYELGASMATAAFVTPAAGRHAIYVYELTDGALQVRVNAKEAPALSLQKLPLAREDVEIGEGDGSAFAKTMTVTLQSTPVFLTLLYEGSARSLDATIASEKGTVVTITDETATAFSPGVWSDMRGERVSNAANIDGTTYTVSADAEAFEGTLTLTTLALDLSAPPMPIKRTPVAPPTPEQPPMEDVPVGSVAVAQQGTAIEFTALAGELLVFDADCLPVEEEAPAEDEEGTDEHGEHGEHGEHEHDEHAHGDHEDAPCGDGHGFTVAFYAPDDTLLAIVDSYETDEPQLVELPVDGAYVAFVHHSSDEGVALQLAEGDLVSVRELPLVENAWTFYSDGMSGSTMMFDMPLAPIALEMRYTADSLGAFSYASLENEQGVVASSDALVHTFGMRISSWYEVYPENFAAGEHVLYTQSFLPVGVEIVSISYLRELVEEVVVEEEAPEEEATDDETTEGDESAEEEEEQGWNPLSDLIPWI